MTPDAESSTPTRRRLGLLGGIGLCVTLLLLPPPDGMSLAAWRTAAVAGLMAVWWISEAVDLTVTAFVPLFLFPVLDILPAGEVSSAYAGQIMFLFFGAFFLALATEQWGLHRRVALWIVSRIGGSPRRLILGFFGAAALLSMWMSNTASTVVMLPIALAILSHADAQGYDTSRGFATALILGLAYSASIGGVSTPVGTPPNAVFLGAFESLFPDAPGISFLYWMLFGLPTAAVMLVCVWFYLVYIVFRVPTGGWQADRGFLAEQLQTLGPMSRPERRVLVLFSLTALLWMLREDLPLGPLTVPGWVHLFPVPTNIKDSTVAMLMATLLFVIPTGQGDGRCLLDRGVFARMPWGILVLLGGSLALARGVGASGLAEWVGNQLGFLQDLSPFGAIFAVCALLVGLTEVTSNTATTTLMMPILAATATGMSIDPLLLMIPATFAASFAFMLPTATAPNAIVFASRRISLPQMFWAGLGLNLLGVLILPVLLYLIGVPVFDIVLSGQPTWAP